MRIFLITILSLLLSILYWGCGQGTANQTKVYVTITDYTYEYLPESEISIPVQVKVKGKTWTGPVKILIKNQENIVAETEIETTVETDSEKMIEIPIKLPTEIGSYEMVAKVITPQGNPYLNRKLINIVSQIRRLDL